MYARIEEMEVGKVLSIELDTMREVVNVYASAKRLFADDFDNCRISLQQRKYARNGRHAPTLYITKNEELLAKGI